MLRRFFVTASAATLAILSFATSPFAAETKLTAAEIDTLLNGNTISGSWSGTAYKQYYGENGSTMYLAEGSPPSPGKWRTNTQTNMYESWWENTGWTPYVIVRTDDGLAWVSGDSLHYFTVMEGKQISW